MSRLSGFFFCMVVSCMVVGLLPALATAAPTPSVGARLPCHDYQKIVETLGKRYGETPTSLGLQSNGHVLQVFTSPESGSWTILSVAPTGVGCIVAAGKNWHEQQPNRNDPAT